jgi:adenylate kinase
LALLCEGELGLTHISTGELFRRQMARRTTLGRRVSRYVASGRLVPDRLVVEVMAAQLTPAVLSGGFVLDGFPRTAAQAAGLDRVLRKRRHPLDGAVYLFGSEPLLIRRLTGRRVCSRCGANYHLRTMRPRRRGRCDRCQGPLVTRVDDAVGTILKRLAIDRAMARPLLAYYRKRGLLYPVNGAGRIEPVFARTRKLFHRQGWLASDDRTEDTRRN